MEGNNDTLQLLSIFVRTSGRRRNAGRCNQRVDSVDSIAITENGKCPCNAFQLYNNACIQPYRLKYLKYNYVYL